jgi:hypothetical protein
VSDPSAAKFEAVIVFVIFGACQKNAEAKLSLAPATGCGFSVEHNTL